MIEVPDDSWHFARPVLAKKYLDTYEVGLISERVAHGDYQIRDEGLNEWIPQLDVEE